MIELAIASTLLAMGVIGVFGSLLYARSMSEGSIFQNAAVTAVQGYIEQMKNMEFNDLPYTTSSGTVISGSGATSTQIPTLLLSTTGTPPVATVVSDPLVISTTSTLPDISTIGVTASTAIAGVTDNIKFIDVNSTPTNTTDDLRLNIRVWVQDISDTSVSATQVRAITIQYAWQGGIGRNARIFRSTLRTIRSAVPTY